MATGSPTRTGSLRFRLLGPIEVWRGDRPVRLGGVRQRELLAVLLLHANEVVPAERLIEELYSGDPSGSAANALQAAVYRLRRALDDHENGDGEVLTTQPRGYLLHATPDQLDVTLFETLAGEGRGALVDGDPARAATLLREALALWRGPALADLALLDWVQPEVRRLDELRLATLMDRIDADLAAGNATSVIPELELLVETNPLQERLRGQLMLALYRAGRQADALAAYRAMRELLRDELGLEPSRPLQNLERAILTQDDAIEASAAAPLIVCPFKGLASFEADDAEFFFGRERLVRDLIARLAGATLVGIVGASGAGKSSILRAGVLQQLATGVLPGSERRRIVLVRPGARPVAELHRRLGDDPEEHVVVAVDQLEEVFTVCPDDHQRVEFLDVLAGLAVEPSSRVLVIVALRADFYGSCAASPQFAEALSRSHVLVGPMARDELSRAIELPAARAGLQTERTLVDALVSDVAGQPGALPLLSTTLLELWRRRDGRQLRLESYRMLGGVQGAVARLAEAAYEELGDREREAVHAIMLRLTVGEGEAASRRRVPLADFDERGVLERLITARLLTVSDGEVEVAHEALLREWPRLQQWLDEDRDARRLREHLVAAAREWDERGRDRADLYRGARLSAALDWSEQHERELNELERAFMAASRDERERELLLQRRRVRRLLTLAAGVAALLLLAVAAGAVALAQRSHARREATAALAGELGATAVSEPRIDRAMLLAREAVRLDGSPQTEGTLLATLLRSPAAIATFTGPIDSRPQRLALSPDGRQLAVSDNNGVVRLYDTVRRRLDRQVDNLGFGSPVTYSSAGSLLVAFGMKNGAPGIDVREASSLRLIRRLSLDRRWLTQPTGSSPPLLLTPDGRTLYLAYSVQAGAGSDGAAYVDRWDMRTGRLVSTTAVGDVGSYDLRLVDGGRRLLVLGSRVVTILDRRTLRPVRRVRIPPPPAGRFGPVGAVSPDGRSAAVETAPGFISFVDLRTGRVTPGTGSDAAAISGIGFAPDGRTLVTGGEDGAVIVWDPATGDPVQRLNGHASRVLGIGFGPDGTLFTCSLDGAILEWDLGGARRFGRAFLTTPRPALPRLSGDAQFHTPPLATSPDGSQFAARVGASQVAVYSVRTAKLLRRWAPPVGPEVTGLAWSSRGLAVTGDGGNVQLWSIGGRPRLLRRLRGLGSVGKLPEVVTSVAFAPDGTLLAAGDVGHTPQTVRYRFGTIAVWDTSSGRLLWKLRTRKGTVNAVAFAPDGRTLAAGYEDGTAVLYDVSTARVRRTLTLQGGGDFSFETLGFSPRGLLATGTWAGIVQLWNPGTGREVGRPTLVAAAPVASISFDPTGDTFATAGGSDGLTKLWRTSTLQQFGASLPGDRGMWGDARYSGDGSRLVVVDENGVGEVWPTSLGAWEQHACAVAGRNFTREEWRRFVGGRAYARTC